MQNNNETKKNHEFNYKSFLIHNVIKEKVAVEIYYE